MEKPERRFECSELPEGHYRAELVLVGLTLLWGSTFTAVKVLLEQVSFSWLLAWRFGIAAFFLSIYCLYKRVPIGAHHWRAGIPLSLYLFAGYLTQTIGLHSTTASKSSFITSMTVVLVPLVSLPIERRYPRPNSIFGILLATLGLFFLVRPQGGGIVAGTSTFVMRDLLRAL
jgi:drug/metabolite transporter (DMT)-like permease